MRDALRCSGENALGFSERCDPNRLLNEQCVVFFSPIFPWPLLSQSLFRTRSLFQRIFTYNIGVDAAESLAEFGGESIPCIHSPPYSSVHLKLCDHLYQYTLPVKALDGPFKMTNAERANASVDIHGTNAGSMRYAIVCQKNRYYLPTSTITQVGLSSQRKHNLTVRLFLEKTNNHCRFVSDLRAMS